MRMFAAALAALTLFAGAALAASDDDAAPPSDAPVVALDDAGFDAQFQCPETLADADARIDELHRYVDWARDTHPDWTFRKRLDVRYGLLRRHACAQTLANIAAAAKPAFAP